jgi:hypothetical protein
VAESYLQATFLKADFANKNILILGNWTRKLEKLETFYLLGEIKKIFKKIPKSDFGVVFNIDSSLSSTIHSSVSLLRAKPKDLIDEGSLDNLISQAIWKIFDRHRLGISKKLKICEVDVLLSDVCIHGIKIDSHKVVNPIGFSAKSLEIYLSITFTAKDFIKGLHKIIPANKIISINESGVLLSKALFSAIGNEPIYLVEAYSDNTKVFQAYAENYCYLGEFRWGESRLLKSLSNNMKLEENISRKIMEIYSKNEGSDHFIKKIENYLIEECRVLANEIEALAREPKKIYLNFHFDFPASLISRRFDSRFSGGFSIELLSTNLIMKNLGFTVQFSRFAHEIKNLAVLFSSVWNLSLTHQNEKATYLANRRARWIFLA